VWNLAAHIGVKVGAPLLSAQSRDDLDEWIDRVIEGTDLVELSELGLRVLTDETFQQVMTQERHVPTEVWSAFGKGAALELEEGDRLALAIAEGWVRGQRAYLRLLASIPGISVSGAIRHLAVGRGLVPRRMCNMRKPL
jgi:hypothetical protein